MNGSASDQAPGQGSGRTQPRARRRLPRFHRLTPLLLAAVWVLLWGALTPAAAVGGLLLGFLVVLLFPLPPLSLGVWVRPWPLLVLIGYFLLDLLIASVHVAASASAPWIQPRGRILIVPLRSDHDLFGVLTAELTTLVPGSIVIDLDTSRREMVVHIFDASAGDDATFRARVLQQEARVLRALARRAEEILAVDPDSSDTDTDTDTDAGVRA